MTKYYKVRLEIPYVCVCVCVYCGYFVRDESEQLTHFSLPLSHSPTLKNEPETRELYSGNGKQGRPVFPSPPILLSAFIYVGSVLWTRFIRLNGAMKLNFLLTWLFPGWKRTGSDRPLEEHCSEQYI